MKHPTYHPFCFFVFCCFNNIPSGLVEVLQVSEEAFPFFGVGSDVLPKNFGHSSAKFTSPHVLCRTKGRSAAWPASAIQFIITSRTRDDLPSRNRNPAQASELTTPCAAAASTTTLHHTLLVLITVRRTVASSSYNNHYETSALPTTKHNNQSLTVYRLTGNIYTTNFTVLTHDAWQPITTWLPGCRELL